MVTVDEEDVRVESGEAIGVGSTEAAQGVGKFAGEANGVFYEVEEDQYPAHRMLGHRSQDGEVQGGSAQRLLGLPVGCACAERGDVEAGAKLGVGDGRHHDPVLRGPAVLDGLSQGVLEDFLPVACSLSMLFAAASVSGMAVVRGRRRVVLAEPVRSGAAKLRGVAVM